VVSIPFSAGQRLKVSTLWFEVNKRTSGFLSLFQQGKDLKIFVWATGRSPLHYVSIPFSAGQRLKGSSNIEKIFVFDRRVSIPFSAGQRLKEGVFL